METFKIVRHWETGGKRVQQKGLTLAEAKAHCSLAWSKGTNKRGVRWFDVFTKE
jgi:hypothetical protein